MSQKLDQDEIWDDSALVESWNEAVAEYKKYHSVHAKGANVEEIEEFIRSESKPARQLEKSTTEADGPSNTSGAGGETDAVADSAPPIHAPVDGQPGPPPFPTQAILGSMRDDNLKKLLMSWYYAGYYTGLVEGQQQAQQPQP